MVCSWVVLYHSNPKFGCGFVSNTSAQHHQLCLSSRRWWCHLEVLFRLALCVAGTCRGRADWRVDGGQPGPYKRYYRRPLYVADAGTGAPATGSRWLKGCSSSSFKVLSLNMRARLTANHSPGPSDRPPTPSMRASFSFFLPSFAIRSNLRKHELG